ncbi:gig2-like protein [Stylonychia lemnae]|uniref:Gig2-like protein n=1 Tax=Stylonychia lemnae TaxID=5949 RepID=A0A078ABK6_STYLE|nr:gig2-like protein [Stylonychia lemnae]|eukprot:CDW79569.1 gig2-like protein [Stylonychia lemnae]
MENSKKKCKISACSDNHAKHYCRVCKDKDSDHFARDCTQGIILYHGTRVSFIKSIIANGLQPSKHGRLDSGIYFTDRDTAILISKHRGQGTGVAVFKCRVNTDEQSCVEGTHPVWKGVTTSTFQEWCLKDPLKHRIMGFEVIDGEFEDAVNLPRGEIIVNGSTMSN